MKISFCFFCIFLFSSFLAWADEADTISSRQVLLEEVVVQSFKQNKDFKTAPLSVSSLNGTAIRNRNITGIREFSSQVPNLFIPDYGSKLSTTVYIRGVGSKINAPSVGLYVDGVPFFEKSAFDFDFAEVDRIEVLRGPQGTLYGRNTMGGIINVYTKSPLKYQGTNLAFSAGSYANLNGSASHYGRIDDSFGYALSANYHHSDGFFTNLHTGRKADKENSGSGRIRLEWKLRSNLSLQLISNLDRLNQGGYPYALYDTLTGKVQQVDYNEYSFYKRTLSTTGVTLAYTTDRFSLNSQTAFQSLSDDQGVDQDFTPKNVYFANQRQRQKMVSEELNIKSVTDGWYKWMFGVFGFWQGINNEVALDYFTQKYTTRKLYTTPTYGVALYHQSTLDRLFTDGLSLTFGLRYDYERASTDYRLYKEQKESSEQTDAFDSRLSFSQLTPKMSLQYTFPGSRIVYATVSKGYKTGGFNTSFSREEDRSFRPEFSWNYEAGTKLQFLQNRLQAEFCLFFIDWKDQQITQRLPTGTGNMLKNAGSSQSKGIEVSLQGNLFNGFMLQVNYGLTQAKFKEYKQSETIDYSGNYLPIVPQHTFSAGADYTIPSPLHLLDRVTFSTNFSAAGKIYWDEKNKVVQPFYGQLNAKVSATKSFLTFALWAKNITNTEYIAYYFESGNKFAQKGKPFTLGCDVQVSF